MNRLQVGDRVLVSVWGGASDYRAVITQRLRSESQSLFEPREATNFPLGTGATVERIYAGRLEQQRSGYFEFRESCSLTTVCCCLCSLKPAQEVHRREPSDTSGTVYGTGRDSEGLDTSFSIREFENINDTQFRSLTDNDYTEVWGIG